jgi:hypothetical protein
MTSDGQPEGALHGGEDGGECLQPSEEAQQAITLERGQRLGPLPLGHANAHCPTSSVRSGPHQGRGREQRREALPPPRGRERLSRRSGDCSSGCGFRSSAWILPAPAQRRRELATRVLDVQHPPAPRIERRG